MRNNFADAKNRFQCRLRLAGGGGHFNYGQKNFATTGKLNYNALVVGLTTNRLELYNRIDRRTEKMFADGLVEEVKNLLASGVNSTDQAMLGIGYKEVSEYLQGNFTLEETISKVAQNTRNFAKRQLTWYRRMNYIKWFTTEN